MKKEERTEVKAHDLYIVINHICITSCLSTHRRWDGGTRTIGNAENSTLTLQKWKTRKRRKGEEKNATKKNKVCDTGVCN